MGLRVDYKLLPSLCFVKWLEVSREVEVGNLGARFVGAGLFIFWAPLRPSELLDLNFAGRPTRLHTWAGRVRLRRARAADASLWASERPLGARKRSSRGRCEPPLLRDRPPGARMELVSSWSVSGDQIRSDQIEEAAWRARGPSGAA